MKNIVVNTFMAIFFKIFLLSYLMSGNVYSQSKIIFARSAGQLNSGSTINLMIYDPVEKTTSLLLKGSVAKRGEYNAATSIDNSRIIFNTYRFSGWKLAIADFKDESISNVKRLTNRSNYEYNGKFSPDGSKIAYQEYNWGTRNTDIFVADKNGKNVIHFVKSDGADLTPDWTQDSKAIVFASGRTSNLDIYIQSLDSSVAKNITNHAKNDFAPSVSSLHNKIAFLSDREGNVNLYTMNPDGSDLTKLTSGLKTDSFDGKQFWPYKTCWSPDGNQIVFNAMIDGDVEIFTIHKDGSDLVQITDNSDSDFSPFWMH